MDTVYIRDGKLIHTDEAVVLACLLHTRATGKRMLTLEELGLLN